MYRLTCFFKTRRGTPRSLIRKLGNLTGCRDLIERVLRREDTRFSCARFLLLQLNLRES